jgi:uncharacterized glyoxalase superfamily metalloenzyme YdcJ
MEHEVERREVEGHTEMEREVKQRVAAAEKEAARLTDIMQKAHELGWPALPSEQVTALKIQLLAETARANEAESAATAAAAEMAAETARAAAAAEMAAKTAQEEAAAIAATAAAAKIEAETEAEALRAAKAASDVSLFEARANAHTLSATSDDYRHAANAANARLETLIDGQRTELNKVREMRESSGGSGADL